MCSISFCRLLLSTHMHFTCWLACCLYAIYLSFSCVYPFFLCFTCLFACLPISSSCIYWLAHAPCIHMLLPYVSCILPFVPLPPIHATCTSLIILVLVFSMPFPICLVHVLAFTCCFMHTYVHFSFMLVLVCHAPFPVLLVYVHAFTCCFMHTSVCLFVTHAFIIFDREYF